MTAWSNDFDFATIFERQIQAFAENIGLCIALSTSGKSINVLKGLEMSDSYGISNFLITGNNMSLVSPDHTILNIYPNPSVDGMIQFNVRDHSTFQVFDISGSLLFEDNVSKGLNKLDLSFLASGTYLLHLVGDLNYSSIWIRN